MNSRRLVMRRPWGRRSVAPTSQGGGASSASLARRVPGAGKTCLTQFLQHAVPDSVVAVVPMDGFHLANEMLEAAGTRQH